MVDTEPLLTGKIILVSGGTQGVGAGLPAPLPAKVRRWSSPVAGSFLAADVADIPAAQGTVAHLVILLLSEASAVVTGSIIDWDQNVPGAHD